MKHIGIREHLPTLCCILGVLLGLLLLCYPMVSNALYEQRQDGVIETYTATAGYSDLAQERAEALAAAQAYNRQLATGILSLEDPFLTPTVAQEDGEQRSILDLSGTGVIATLSIPALDLELPVYYGTDSDTLAQGIGVLEISSLPVGGEGTHTVLCGHSGLSSARLFSDLDQLTVGDVFTLQVLGQTLAYQVDQITTVRPEDLSQLEIDPDEDYCTLLTCTPYGVNTHRLLVRGTRVEPEEESAVETETESVDALPSTWLREYLFSLAICAALVVVVFFLGQLLGAAWRHHRRLK